jgi:hypothetical protein
MKYTAAAGLILSSVVVNGIQLFAHWFQFNLLLLTINYLKPTVNEWQSITYENICGIFNGTIL